MLAVCQLLIPEEGDTGASETSSDVNAQLLNSKICFETIIRLYYLRNGYEGANMTLLHYLAVLSFMALGDIGLSPSAADSASQQDTRGTLILAAKGLYDQGKNYFMSDTVSHVLRNQMAHGDLAILAQYCTTMNEDPALQAARARHVKAQYPLNIVNMTSDPEARRLENMVKQYEHLAVEQAHLATEE
jgi:hypothetical protein